MPEMATQLHEYRAVPKDRHGGGITILDALSVRIYRPDSGFPNLIISGHACYPRIRVLRCFPLSERSAHISLRDRDNNEIGLIEDLSYLDEGSRRIIQEELDKRYFVSEITDIYSIKNQYGAMIFDVETNRGRRVFDIRDRHRNIVRLSPDRLFFIDGDGCQYDIPNTQRLSSQAKGQLYKIL